MHSVRLKISDSIYERLMGVLNTFNKNDLKIEVEDTNYLENKKYLEKELDEVKEGKAKFYTAEELEERLENVIKKHEDNL